MHQLNGRRSSWKGARWPVILAALALIVAACGGADGTSTTAAAGGTTAAGERPFEGVTLQFAKAPHGEDEAELMAEWLAPFEEETGITVEHTIVPWDQLEAIYSANFAGDDVFDVMYQVSTHLTLFGDRGAFEDVSTRFADWEDRARVPDSIVNASVYKDALYGVPVIIGTIVMFVNLDLLEAAGITEIPTTTDELIAAAQAVQTDEVWGFYTPTTVGDFGWYFNLQNIHNFGGDIISDDFSAVTIDSEPVQQATQYAVDLICTHKVQPPLGQYDREGGIELFKAGKLAFLLDEPLRVEVFQEEGLPFEWDIAQPVGAPDGTQTQFSTTGHWSIGAKSDNKDAAWELVKYLSGQEFMTVFNERFGFVPARDDVDVTGGNPLLAKNFEWAMTTWDGLVTHPKISQILDEYAKALEAATTCNTPVAEALADAQARATEVLGQ